MTVFDSMIQHALITWLLAPSRFFQSASFDIDEESRRLPSPTGAGTMQEPSQVTIPVYFLFVIIVVLFFLFSFSSFVFFDLNSFFVRLCKMTVIPCTLMILFSNRFITEDILQVERLFDRRSFLQRGCQIRPKKSQETNGLFRGLIN